MEKTETDQNFNYQIWAAEESWLTGYLNDKADFKFKGISKKDIEAYQAQARAYLSTVDEKKLPSILEIADQRAFINIQGRLSATGPDFYDWLEDITVTKYGDIIECCDILENNAAVEEVFLMIDSPGGEFHGADNVWKTLFALSEKKSLIAVNQRLALSGGYYLASAADTIQSTSESNETGSIGIVVVGFDYTEAREKRGIKKVVILSRNAPYKLTDFGSEKTLEELRKRVDTYERFFLERVSEGRGLDMEFVKKNFGRGGALVAKNPIAGEPDALSVGMIDEVIGLAADPEIKCPKRRKRKFKTAETGVFIPASPNQKQEKNMAMNLDQLLAANPEAKAEYERLIETKAKESFDQGYKKGKEEIEAKIERASKFLGEDSPYNAKIQAIAVKVMKGERSMESLETVVDIFDMEKEKKKSKEAKKETKEQGDTPSQPPPPKSDDGVIRTEEDWKNAQTIAGKKTA